MSTIWGCPACATHPWVSMQFPIFVKRNDNMKLYIISIEDVYEGSSEHKVPIVKTSLEEAQQKLTELYNNAVQLYGEQFDSFDKEDNYFEMYEMGYYCQNHYSAVIDEVEIA